MRRALEQIKRIDHYSPLQWERYERIVRVTLEVLREVGHEATTIQVVAQRAKVGNGAVYRYFGSKDALIYVATAAWGNEIGHTQRTLPREHLTLKERVVASVDGGISAFIREPNLAAAWVAAIHSTDREITPEMRDNARHSMNSLSIPDPENPLRHDLDLIMEAQTTYGMWKWVHGLIDADTFKNELLRSVEMVFEAHSASGE